MSEATENIKAFGQPIVVTRTAPGAYGDDGEWHPSVDPPVVTTTKASIQPSSSKERELLPAAVQTEEIMKVFATYPLRTDDEESSTVADTFTFKGRKYKIIAANRYEMGTPLDHTKAFAALIKESA